MGRFFGHLKIITLHKIRVTKLCFRCGLYKQGILHDLSKYTPVEFLSGVKYYQGDRSPINREKEVIGYSLGWLHHKGRNKHHWEYWLDNGDPIKAIEMPVNYVIEMFCDRVAACQTYQKEAYRDDSALRYYLNGKSRCLMHENTHALLEELLTYLSDHGLDETIAYIRKHYRK